MTKRLRELLEEKLVISSLNRIARAVERQTEILESLLPSPLTEPGFVNNDQKPRGVETLKTYSDREAYRAEVNQMREDIARETRDELSET